MSYRMTELGVLVRLDPPAAKRAILNAYQAAGANLHAAAQALDVTARSLHRYVLALNLQGDLSRLRARAIRDGSAHRGRWEGHVTEEQAS